MGTIWFMFKSQQHGKQFAKSARKPRADFELRLKEPRGRKPIPMPLQ